MRKLLASSLAVFAAAWTHAYDLKSDWSDSQNPSGPWLLKKNAGAAFQTNQPDFWSDGRHQKAWADQPFQQIAHVPVWMKVSETEGAASGLDIHIGDIMMHGSETDRTGSAVTGVQFSAPMAGMVKMSGSLWDVRDLHRTMNWTLLKNGSAISSGSLPDQGTFSRSHPFMLSSGSGGPSAMTQNLAANDTIELRMTSVPADLGELIGVDFQVAYAYCPGSYTITEGSYFSGNLASLGASDNNRLRFFNDDNTLGATLEVEAFAPRGDPTSFAFEAEASVTRPALSISIQLFDFTVFDYIEMASDEASLTDTAYRVQPTSDLGNYISGESLYIRSRIQFAPINDEVPSQDGWLHAVDEACWEIV